MYIREQILQNNISLQYIMTENKLTDLFTKGLQKITFVKFQNLLIIERNNVLRAGQRVLSVLPFEIRI